MKRLPKPYFSRGGITLYCGDARDIAPLLRGSFDAIIADPPYNETNLHWDTWPDGWPELLRPLSRQMWCFGSLKMFWNQRDEFSGWRLAQDIVWEKHNGSGLRTDRFRRVHELAVHFYQGSWSQIYTRPPKIRVQDTPRKTLIRGRKPAHWGGLSLGKGYEYNGERLMRSVMQARSCHGYAINETQKPEQVIEPLLTSCVPIGGTVFDPFSGSGTVLVVASRTGRRAVGIELREEQCRETQRRLLWKENKPIKLF